MISATLVSSFILPACTGSCRSRTVTGYRNCILSGNIFCISIFLKGGAVIVHIMAFSIQTRKDFLTFQKLVQCIGRNLITINLQVIVSV